MDLNSKAAGTQSSETAAAKRKYSVILEMLYWLDRCGYDGWLSMDIQQGDRTRP
jgi:hypothetical protein